VPARQLEGCKCRSKTTLGHSSARIEDFRCPNIMTTIWRGHARLRLTRGPSGWSAPKDGSHHAGAWRDQNTTAVALRLPSDAEAL